MTRSIVSGGSCDCRNTLWLSAAAVGSKDANSKLAVRSEPPRSVGADGGTESAGWAHAQEEQPAPGTGFGAFSGRAGGAAQQQQGAPSGVFTSQHDRTGLADASEQCATIAMFEAVPEKMGAQVSAAGKTAANSVATTVRPESKARIFQEKIILRSILRLGCELSQDRLAAIGESAGPFEANHLAGVDQLPQGRQFGPNQRRLRDEKGMFQSKLPAQDRVAEVIGKEHPGRHGRERPQASRRLLLKLFVGADILEER